MEAESPAILVSPREFPVDPDLIDSLASALHNAIPGQVIHSAFPVSIYHLIDGLWIESGDLHSMLGKVEDVKGVKEGSGNNQLCAD